MVDCFSLQNIKEIVEDFRAIEAHGEMLITSYEAVNYADAIEQLIAENEKLKKRCELLQGNNILLRGCVDKYNIEQIERFREENAKLKKERDAAMRTMPHDCNTCSKYCNITIAHKALFTKRCDEWEWRGVQNEE